MCVCVCMTGTSRRPAAIACEDYDNHTEAGHPGSAGLGRAPEAGGPSPVTLLRTDDLSCLLACWTETGTWAGFGHIICPAFVFYVHLVIYFSAEALLCSAIENLAC